MSFDGGPMGRAWPQPDVPHEPACLRVGTQWHDRGTRASGERIFELWCIDCHARLILVDGVPESLPTSAGPDAAQALSGFQREKLALIPAAIANLKHEPGGASTAAIAAAIGVDRGTLATWDKDGIVSLNDLRG